MVQTDQPSLVPLSHPQLTHFFQNWTSDCPMQRIDSLTTTRPAGSEKAEKYEDEGGVVLGHVVVTVWPNWPPVCGLKVAWGCGGSWRGGRRWMVGARQMWFLEQECAAAGLGQSRQPTGGTEESSDRHSRNLCNQLSRTAKALLLCLSLSQPTLSTFVSQHFCHTDTLLSSFYLSVDFSTVLRHNSPQGKINL